MSSSNAKKANLSATRKDRIKLPNYDSDSVGKAYHISEFLSHPSGIQAMLNTSALQSFQFIDTNTYRSIPFLILFATITPYFSFSAIKLPCCGNNLYYAVNIKSPCEVEAANIKFYLVS